ncbi:MAG: DUF4435 domain-containing protein [Acidobacteria bacterium]|nr:DUF4435 domain-containing protein [Acidobacteriota bacterium]MCI0662400.1 DUF4435 domain-containing protein [Acidobacteriota bacterium]
MREAITANRVANQIRLLRSQFLGAFLIVEGDTDKRIYSRFIKAEACRIVIAYGRENAVAASESLERGGFAGVLAVVDADFDLLESRDFASSNIFLTDTHDLETMMLKSPALEKLLLEMGSEDKHDEFRKKRGKEVREALLEEGLHLGYLRWVSLRHNHALRFEGLNYRNFTDLGALTVDQSKLIRTVKNHSQKPQLSEPELQRQIEAIRDEAHDKWLVCCGHDLIGLLSVGLHKALGSRNWKEVETEILERSLRLAYEFAWFRDTQLYAAIKEWEGINNPFQVFLRAGGKPSEV